MKQFPNRVILCISLTMLITALACTDNTEDGGSKEMDSDVIEDVTSADVGDVSADGSDTSDDVAEHDADVMESDTEADAEMDVEPDVVDEPGTGWTIGVHPCVASSRTDALHCDDALTCYVGCGTGATGLGMFLTTDGGATWQAPVTTPPNLFDTMRVYDISRSADGKLYIAGTDTTSDVTVRSLDAMGILESVVERQAMIGFNFSVGSFRRNSDGWAIAESLVAADLLFREGDDGQWTSGVGFWLDGDEDDLEGALQFLDLETYGNAFYGVGSTINRPPIVFLPKWSAGSFDFQIVEMRGTALGIFNGFFEGIAITEEGITVGGLDSSNNRGVLFSYEHGVGDVTDVASWTPFSAGSLFPGKSTWIHDVCRGANKVVYAIGRQSTDNWGIVLRSTDGGLTFTDISPYEVDATESSIPAATRCAATDSGVIVVGAEGLVAVYRD